MSQGDEGEAPPSKSFLYVIGSAMLSAFVLGITVVFSIHSYQWHAAINELRAEPGVEILKIERTGFLKRRLLGLKDPLAPPIGNLLKKHGIAPHTVEVALTEYHSLNTPYAKQREQDTEGRLSALHQDLLAATADYTKSLNEQREEDLERMTRMLLKTKFPEAMEKVEITRQGKDWEVSGELYAPDYVPFASNASTYVLEGELDLDNLSDLTHLKTSALEHDIGRFNLLATDLDGNLVHTERMIRLISEYDKVCELSDIQPPNLRLEIHAAQPEAIKRRMSDVKSSLTGPDKLPVGRFATEAYIGSYSDEGPAIYLKLLPLYGP